MGKPLSRPDCLRQSPACLGKGEEEDGYIEDCYVPQRSIYDTMRINEQIDQGGKPNQPSKNTLEKGEGSTISSNGTLGAPGAFESKVPESKKLDERVIFDALKLSSDVSKSAPAPPRRRPNPEKKENINRRSWKSFMPPNFPEFAERIEASLSEVSEAGVSNPSLQERQGSAPRLAEGAQLPDHGGSTSEPLTVEHLPQLPGVPEIHEVKQLSDAFCGLPQDECQPLLEREDLVVGMTGGQRRDLSSATWPRTMKNIIKAGLGGRRHDTLEADDTECVIEMVPLSPCLSEELLDPGMNVLIAPNLREKTESELKFEEDERLIMMEAEKELEEGLLPQKEQAAEKRDSGLTDISEERGPESASSKTVTEAAEGFVRGRGTPECPPCWQELWDESQPQAVSSAPVPQETHQDLHVAAAARGEEEEEDGACRAEARTVYLEEEGFASGLGASLLEQFSDTDSVQMFLELEQLCMNEEKGDGAAPGDLEVQDVSLGSEGLDPQEELEQLCKNSAEASQQVPHPEVSMTDSAVVSDLEDFDATYGSQVASNTEPTLSESYSERETSGDSENVMFPSPPGAKDAVSQHSLSSLVSQIEEWGAELQVTHELSKNQQVGTVLDIFLGEPMATVDSSCWKGGSPHVYVFWGGREVEEEIPPAPCAGAGGASPNHDELATTAEELDSQVDFDLTKYMEDPDGSGLPACYEPNPSEMTDLSNWDVPELVSEDEVPELDKENFLLSGGHAIERRDVESSQVPLEIDLVLLQDPEEPLKPPDSPKDLEKVDSSLSCQLEGFALPLCSGEVAASMSALPEETPKADEQTSGGSSPTRDNDFWECGALELLFGQVGNSDVWTRECGGEDVLGNSSSSSLVAAEGLCEGQPSLEGVSSGGEDPVSTSPLASDEGAGEELPGTGAGTPTIASPPLARESILSCLPALFAAAPSAAGSVASATSLPTSEEVCGPVATWVPHAVASVPALPSKEESSPPFPLCIEKAPSVLSDGEEKPRPEDLVDPEEVPGSSKELVQGTQEVKDLDSLSSSNVESLEAEVDPAELEGGDAVLPQVLWETLPTTPLSPPSRALEAEEELTCAVPATEGPSTHTPSCLDAEGPAAGTDGLVPDNEVLVLCWPVCFYGEP